jgi:hypothetical protein
LPRIDNVAVTLLHDGNQLSEALPVAGSDATLTIEYEEALPSVMEIDKNRLRQVLASGVSNAIKVGDGAVMM